MNIWILGKDYDIITAYQTFSVSAFSKGEENMIPEKRFLNQIQQVLARLMQPLWLLDTEGTVLLP